MLTGQLATTNVLHTRSDTGIAIFQANAKNTQALVGGSIMYVSNKIKANFHMSVLHCWMRLDLFGNCKRTEQLATTNLLRSSGDTGIGLYPHNTKKTKVLVFGSIIYDRGTKMANCPMNVLHC